MKLNPDCVRDLLLALQDELTLNDRGGFNKLYLTDILVIERMKPYADKDVFYTIYTLKDAGYLEAVVQYGMQNTVRTCYVENITFAGQTFAENVASTKVWEKVKKIAASIGSASIPVLCEAAIELTRQLPHL